MNPSSVIGFYFLGVALGFPLGNIIVKSILNYVDKYKRRMSLFKTFLKSCQTTFMFVALLRLATNCHKSRKIEINMLLVVLVDTAQMLSSDLRKAWVTFTLGTRPPAIQDL